MDCFYVGENMLVINPDECIDCGVCEPECPAEAIVPDSNDRAGAWLERNMHCVEDSPNITRTRGSPARRGRAEGQARQGGILLARAGDVS